LTSGSEDNTVKLWSIEFQKEITTLEREGDRGEVSTAAVSPDENYFAYVSDDNMVRVLSL
jgi:WD40 repeat protein